MQSWETSVHAGDGAWHIQRTYIFTRICVQRFTNNTGKEPRLLGMPLTLMNVEMVPRSVSLKGSAADRTQVLINRQVNMHTNSVQWPTGAMVKQVRLGKFSSLCIDRLE